MGQSDLFSLFVAKHNRRGLDENLSSVVDVHNTISHDHGKNSHSSFLFWIIAVCAGKCLNASQDTPAIVQWFGLVQCNGFINASCDVITLDIIITELKVLCRQDTHSRTLKQSH